MNIFISIRTCTLTSKEHETKKAYVLSLNFKRNDYKIPKNKTRKQDLILSQRSNYF